MSGQLDKSYVRGKRHEIAVRYRWSWKQAVARSREQSLLSRALESDKASVKKIKRRKRKSKTRSRETIRAIDSFEAITAKRQFPSLVVGVVGAVSAEGAFPGRPAAPRWADTTVEIKLMFGMRAIKQFGGEHAWAFSLRLGPNVEMVARSAPQKLLKNLRETVKRACERDVPIIVAIGGHGGFHVHGAFAALDPEELNLVRKTLLTVAGPWANTRCKNRQLHMTRLGVDAPPDGWARYLLRQKNIPSAQRECPRELGRVWSVSHAVTREAKRLYGDIRQRMHVALEERRSSPEKQSSSHDGARQYRGLQPACGFLGSIRQAGHEPRKIMTGALSEAVAQAASAVAIPEAPTRLDIVHGSQSLHEWQSLRLLGLINGGKPSCFQRRQIERL